MLGSGGAKRTRVLVALLNACMSSWVTVGTKPSPTGQALTMSDSESPRSFE